MALRTPLLHPQTYFEERGFEFRPAAAAVGAAVLTLVVALLGFGALLSNRFADAGQPEAASAVWAVFGGQLFAVVVAMLVGWFLVAGVLHLLARAVVGHEGSFGQTVVVTGWATVPSTLTTLVAFMLLALALNDVSLATPEMFVEQFEASVASSGGVRALVAFLVAGWQTYIYASGLEVAFEDTSGSAWLVAGIVAYGGWVLSLL